MQPSHFIRYTLHFFSISGERTPLRQTPPLGKSEMHITPAVTITSFLSLALREGLYDVAIFAHRFIGQPTADALAAP
jgi:hypothetical protein